MLNLKKTDIPEQTYMKEINNNTEKGACPLCKTENEGLVMQCFSCKLWCHYICTKLPPYQLHIYGSTTRKFTCEMCITMTNSFCTKLIETGSLAECHLLSDVSCLDLVLSENTPKQTVESEVQTGNCSSEF